MKSKEPLLVYCDCGKYRREGVLEAVKCFIQAETGIKRRNGGKSKTETMRTVQLLLPREVDREDSVLYLMLTLESLLSNQDK